MGPVAGAVGVRTDGRRGLRVLITVTLNPNQLRAHVGPIAGLAEVERLTLVTDRPAPSIPKLRTVVPPPWLVRVAGRAGAKLLTGLAVAVRERPDWVLAYNLVPHSINALVIARLTRTRVLMHLIGGPREWVGGGHASDNKVLGRLPRPVPLLERVLVAAIRRADLVAVMGSGARADLLARGLRPDQVVVLPASVDERRFAGVREREPVYDLCTASQLNPRKRISDLLAAAANLKGSHLAIEHPAGRPLRVAIAGRGPLEAELRAEAARLRLADAVDFLGFVEDVESVYARSRVFVLTSRSEGLSIALTEAMAAGLPVVATDVGEVRDVVVPGETGELFAVGDVEALTGHLAALLADEPRRVAMGRAAASAALAAVAPARIAEINRRVLLGGSRAPAGP